MKTSTVLVILISLMTASCSSQKFKSSKDPEHMISEYIEDQKVKHQGIDEKTEAYLTTYEEYLKSVSTIYANHEAKDKFPQYLEDLKEQSDELAEIEENLPKKFAQETGKDAKKNEREFLLFKTKTMTKFYDKFTEDRALKLRNQVSGETYAELMANYLKFNEKAEGNKTELRVPL